jgi:ABC-type branched-subunit amino acid transport system substrate-binding protein
LSAKEGLSERGAYLFQNALTPKVQVENLVNHVVQEKSFKRFAILAPNDNFGRDMANQFWDLAEKYGGKIVAYESYPADERDFQAPVKALTGVADPKFRKNEQTKVEEFIAQQKQKTGKEPKARLPPVVDFDAIFIPDSPKNVSSIAASLAYFDVSGLPLLGTTEWNTDQLYKRGGKYVEGAIFPGGISMATRNPRQREFIRSYADAFGAAPDLLSGQSFEAMVLIAAAINKSSSDRNDLVSELGSLREFDSPLGQVSFDSTRLARRRIPVLSLGQNGTVTEVQ